MLIKSKEREAHTAKVGGTHHDQVFLSILSISLCTPTAAPRKAARAHSSVVGRVVPQRRRSEGAAAALAGMPELAGQVLAACHHLKSRCGHVRNRQPWGLMLANQQPLLAIPDNSALCPIPLEALQDNAVLLFHTLTLLRCFCPRVTAFVRQGLPAAAPTSSSLLSSLVRWATCESPSSASFARMSLSRRKGRSSVARKGAGRDHDHQSQQGCRHSCSPGTTCHQGSRPGCILGVPCSQETCPLNTPLPHLGLVCAGRALLHQQLATARSCLHPHRKGGRGAQQGGHVAASGAQPAAAAHAATVCTALCAGKAGRATPCCAEAGRARLAAR